MRKGTTSTLAAAGLLTGCGLVAILAGCAPRVVDTGFGDEIPVTTRSEEARRLFLEGRSLAERVRLAEARDFFERAVEEDAGFALAHLMLANTARSPREFFDGLGRAVELAENVSEGERLLILAQDAGSRGDLSTQRQLLASLVELHPRDERARFAFAGYYFGRQDFERAIEEYRQATVIAPDFSPAYNLLGYAYRSAGRLTDAEEAFERYIELIPDEPNPYDSYAELLMKGGRFEESIANYEKALEIDPRFVPSFVGIANNQIFLGRGEEARATLARLLAGARDDGERRQALLWTAVSYLHEGDYPAAEEQCRRMLEIAHQAGDPAQAAGDLALIGDLRLESGDRAGALAAYDEALAAIGEADVNEDVKDRFRRQALYRQARVALAAADREAAAARIAAYADAVARRNIPSEVRRLHELQGLEALAAGDATAAADHLARADQQDPRVLYELARAYRRAGDLERARQTARTAAEWNQLGINYAFVRARARRLVEEL